MVVDFSKEAMDELHIRNAGEQFDKAALSCNL
jgi:hypothetical protein